MPSPDRARRATGVADRGGRCGGRPGDCDRGEDGGGGRRRGAAAERDVRHEGLPLRGMADGPAGWQDAGSLRIFRSIEGLPRPEIQSALGLGLFRHAAESRQVTGLRTRQRRDELGRHAHESVRASRSKAWAAALAQAQGWRTGPTARPRRVPVSDRVGPPARYRSCLDATVRRHQTPPARPS